MAGERSDFQAQIFQRCLGYAILQSFNAIPQGESMIDPVQLPLLLKAIDFVFEEGRKILEERRERRKLNDQASAAAPPKSEEPEPANELVLAGSDQGEGIKQELLSSKVDELLWQNHQLEIQHLVKLMETYSRNYHLASEQYAKWGSALVPPIIVHNMQEAENAMLETLKQLEVVLAKVYKKDLSLMK
jgi:hypothetical protein